MKFLLHGALARSFANERHGLLLYAAVLALAAMIGKISNQIVHMVNRRPVNQVAVFTCHAHQTGTSKPCGGCAERSL